MKCSQHRENPMRRVRKEDARAVTCRECGRLWYIATVAVIPRGGYICPWCRVGGKTNANGCR